MLPEEKEALRPYVFYSNNYFVSAGFIADAGVTLAQMNNQVKKEEENSVEIFNPWNKEIKLLEIMLKNQDSIQEEKSQFQYWEMQNVKMQEKEDNSKKEGKDDRATVTIKVQQSRDERNQQLEDLLDREIELIRRIMMKVRNTSVRKKRSRSNKLKCWQRKERH